MPTSTNHRIADLAISFAEQASKEFPNVDIGALKIQLAAGLLKAVNMADIFSQLFPDSVVDLLIKDDDVDLDSHHCDLV
jgi:hypothetical protein